jgi:hypothetical protein
MSCSTLTPPGTEPHLAVGYRDPLADAHQICWALRGGVWVLGHKCGGYLGSPSPN